jgi:hypothetical protein
LNPNSWATRRIDRHLLRRVGVDVEEPVAAEDLGERRQGEVARGATFGVFPAVTCAL